MLVVSRFVIQFVFSGVAFTFMFVSTAALQLGPFTGPFTKQILFRRVSDLDPDLDL